MSINIPVEILYEIRDKIKCPESYFLFCKELKIPYNIKNKFIFRKQTNLNNFTFDFFYFFADTIDWDILNFNIDLPIDLVKSFKHRFNWDYISINEYLSVDFIREFKDELDWNSLWDNLKINVKYSRDFIKEFIDYVNWIDISINIDKFSIDFIREFQNRIYKETLTKNQYMLLMYR